MAEEKWGQEEESRECQTFLNSGLEGVKKPEALEAKTKSTSRSKALKEAAENNHRITEWTRPVAVQGGKGCKEYVSNPVCTRTLAIEWEGQGRLCIEWMSKIGGDFEIARPRCWKKLPNQTV